MLTVAVILLILKATGLLDKIGIKERIKWIKVR